MLKTQEDAGRGRTWQDLAGLGRKLERGVFLELMNRRTFLQRASVGNILLTLIANGVLNHTLQAADGELQQSFKDTPRGKEWLNLWGKYILRASRSRYCDKEMGEELGWLVSPFLNGYYYGYLATRDPKWVERFVDWADACVRRGVKEPDGFIGWPKGDGGGGDSKAYQADSLLGEAMMLRPVVLMADEILRTPILKGKWGANAQGYLELAEQVFKKWDSRDCWREVKAGGVWVVPAFGIDGQTGEWSAGYANRKTTGFTNPDNKQNHIARWLVALYDVTRNPIYRERAEKWFQVMKLRMKARENGRYYVWNYWEPAGPWDYKADGSPSHWVGVHPNGGYYQIDVEGIVCAFEHGWVFTREDIDRLIATNRDFMWNQKLENAQFQRIDGGQPDPRWKNTPGVLWTALVPHDEMLRKIFLANHTPGGWSGLSVTPWILARDPQAPGRPNR